MLTILFYLRANKKNPTKAKVYCRVSLNGTRATPFSTNVAVNPKDFIHQKTKNANDNNLLDSIREGIKALNRKMDYELDVYTVHDLTDTYLGKRDFDSTLLCVYSDFIGFKREDGREESTLEVLENYRKALKTFVDKKRKGILIRQVDITFVSNYHSHLLTSGYAKSSIVKHITYLKSVMDYAIIQGLIRYNPIKPYKVERPRLPKPAYLDQDELHRILTFDFDTCPHTKTLAGRLNKVRDIFVMLRFLGVHWQDYMRLTPATLYQDQDGDWVYSATRKKTGVDTLSIVNPIVGLIIDKYEGVDNLPKMSNQRFNDYIKVIFLTCKINKPASSKIGRKSFADHYSNVEPVNDPLLIKMMGLKSAKHLEHYRRVDIRAFKNSK